MLKSIDFESFSDGCNPYEGQYNVSTQRSHGDGIAMSYVLDDGSSIPNRVKRLYLNQYRPNGLGGTLNLICNV
jgi:hypothetical protein